MKKAKEIHQERRLIMNKIMFVTASCMLAVGLTVPGYASNDPFHDGTSPNLSTIMRVEAHQVEKEQHKDKGTQLEQKIKHLENRIEGLQQKPYLDPKGFKRSGWQRLVETWKQDLKAARSEMVWEEKDRTRLPASTIAVSPDREESKEAS